MADPTDLSFTIEAAATQPAVFETDGLSAQSRRLTETIAADQHLAASRARGSAGGCLKPAQVVSPKALETQQKDNGGVGIRDVTER